MFKKTAAALMALAFAGLLSACGTDDPADEAVVSEIIAETETSDAVTEELTEEETTESTEEETSSESDTKNDSDLLGKIFGSEDKTEPATEPGAKLSEEDGLFFVAADSPAFSSINTDENPYILSVGVDSQAAAETLSARESGYSNVMRNDSILGTIFELDSDANDEITRVVIRLTVKDEYIENTLGTFAQYEPELQGIRRLNMFMWIEDMNMSLPIETRFDGNTVCCETDMLGTYDLTDMELWLESMGIEPGELTE